MGRGVIRSRLPADIPVEGRNQQLGDLVRFGPYEVDRRTAEVRKHGFKIKLSGQPLEVLLLLLERPGELVTREELRQCLWSGNVFVDFERSVNSAVKKLRRALNEDPQQPRYIETNPRKGYRFIGVLESETAPLGEPLAEAAHPAEAATAPSLPGAFVLLAKRRKWQIAAALAALLAIGLFMVDGASRRMHKAIAISPPQRNENFRSSIAVLGFKNISSRRDADWLSTAITQMLATELASGDKVRIVPEEVVARAKSDLGLKEKDSYARDTLRELRIRLGSDYVIAGSYVALGDRNSGQVRMDLRLQEAISGETLTSIAVSGKQTEIFDLVARAGREMRTKLGTTVPPEGDVDWRTVLPSNPEAARLYSESLARLRVSENLTASELLRKSLAIESSFALGHAALAQAWSALGYDARALASAQKALSLSNGLPEDERMEIQGRYYELNHDWAGAVGVYRHLCQDYPDDLESGLKLAAAQTFAGDLKDALATLSNLRSLRPPQGNDPRIDLAEAAVAAQSGDYKRQRALAEQAAEKSQSAGARLLLARAWLVEGWALDDQSRWEEALEAFSAAEKIYKEARDPDGTATALNDMGIVLQKQGDLAGAREKLEQARADFHKVGDENGVGAVLTNLGEVYRAQADLTQAESLYREALAIFRQTGRKDNEYATMNSLGGLLYQRGDFRAAGKAFEELLRVRQAAGDKNGTALAKTNLADVLRVQGELDRAVALHEEAIEAFKEMGDRSTTAAAHVSLAKALIGKHDFPTARRILQEALETNRDIGAKGDAAWDRVLLAQVALYEGHPEQFDDPVQESIRELASEQRGADEMEAHAIQARTYVRLGKINEARQSVSRAQSIRGTDWLAKFHLSLAAAEVDAAGGNGTLARSRLHAAQAEAAKVGCKICEAEIRSGPAKLGAKTAAQSAPVLEGKVLQ